MSTATDDSTEVVDPWSTDKSSGRFTDFEGTIVDSFFATDPAYNQGQSLFNEWVLRVDDTDADDAPEETSNRYPVGAKWFTEDGGRTATHPRPNQRFHASSLMGKIIDEVIGATKGYGNGKTASGATPVTNFDGLMDVLRERGNPTDAEVWKGCRFRFEEVSFDYGPDRKADDGSRITSQRSMPVEFLGMDEGEGSGSKAPAKKAAAGKKDAAKANGSGDKVAEAKAKAAAKKAAESDGDGGEGGDGDPILAILDALEPAVADETKLAVVGVLVEAEDHDTFMNAALEVDGVVEHDALTEAIVDDGEGGLWAAAGKNG